MPKYLFNYKVSIKLSMRTKKRPLGRFGGGWNWKLGFQAGGRTVIFSLLVLEVRIDWSKRNA